MKRILFIACLFSVLAVRLNAQKQTFTDNGYLVSAIIHEGDTIPHYQMRTVYIFKPLVFKNKKQQKSYNRLVHNVKKTLPIAKEVNRAIIETYEYLQTLPDEKAREKHLRMVEKGVKEQYTPRQKKLTFSQGKLLIKLINRETNILKAISLTPPELSSVDTVRRISFAVYDLSRMAKRLPISSE